MNDQERQDAPICSRHDHVIAALKEGTETMAVLKAGQIRVESILNTLMERQLESSMKVAKIEVLVQNGLSHNLEAIKNHLEAVCTDLNGRIVNLESFEWFRSWVTKLRDDSFKTIVKIAFMISLIYGFVYGGEKVITKAIEIVTH